jgi:lysozyme
MPDPLRDPPEEAVELIKSFEGIPDGDPATVNIDAYLCPAGIWTIGWGHAIVHEGRQLAGPQHKALARSLYPGGITRQQAVDLLRADLLRFCAGVQRLLKVPVDEQQFGALLAFAFNAGTGALGSSTLLRKLNAGDTAGAAEQFLAWDKARVKGVLQALPGLTRRRRAERALFLGQDWRAVAAQPVSRSRGARALDVLPVPEAPADQKVLKRAPAKKAGARKAVGKKAAAKAPSAKPVAAKKRAGNGTAAQATPAVKPRARTTTATGLPPAPTAKPRARRRAP